MQSIALLTDGIFPMVVGGMQKHSYYLVKYFAEKNIRVDLYHADPSGKDLYASDLFSEKQKKNIRSFVIPFPKAGNLPGHYLKESYRHSVEIYAALVKNGPVDFIYAKGFSGWKLLDEKRKGAKLPKTGVNFHGYEMFQPANNLRSRLEGLLLKGPVRYNTLQADIVFSYGGKISEIIKRIGVKEDRIVELPAGIESGWITSEIKRTEKKRRFIFVGRNEYRKGAEELNAVLRSLIERTDLEFSFVGHVPQGKKIISQNIVYHDIVTDQKELTKIIRSADVLLCPSHSEGMPNVILEGMASGLAIIATDVGAVSLMVDESNGWLIEPRRKDELQRAFISAIEMDANLLDEKKRTSLTKVSRDFRWDRLVDRTINKIDTII